MTLSALRRAPSRLKTLRWTASTASIPRLVRTELCCGFEIFPKFPQISGKFCRPATERQAKHFYAFGSFRLDSEKRASVRDSVPVPVGWKAAETGWSGLNAGLLVGKDELMSVSCPTPSSRKPTSPRTSLLCAKPCVNGTAGGRDIETIPKRAVIALWRRSRRRPTRRVGANLRGQPMHH